MISDSILSLDNNINFNMYINDYPVFMVFWNLFLVIIPFLLFFYLKDYKKKTKFKKKNQKYFSILVFLLWLIFVPNTAYIITDMRHISYYCPLGPYLKICVDSAWMIMFFFLYSIIGWISFVYLLREMKDFIGSIFNKFYSSIFIVLIIPLISLGVLLGLLNRWNSWDLFFYPLSIIKSSFLYFSDFYYFRNWLIFTISFYILYFVGAKIFKDLKLK
jgi:uncharacterized membrane protein